MSEAYRLLKYMVYGATFENKIQDTHRMVCTRAEIELYAEETFDKVVAHLRTGRADGEYSDFQCLISLEASRIFATNKYGYVIFKKKDIGNYS